MFEKYEDKICKIAEKLNLRPGGVKKILKRHDPIVLMELYQTSTLEEIKKEYLRISEDVAIISPLTPGELLLRQKALLYKWLSLITTIEETKTGLAYMTPTSTAANWFWQKWIYLVKTEEELQDVYNYLRERPDTTLPLKPLIQKMYELI
jgi:predicted transcriptional regulator